MKYNSAISLTLLMVLAAAPTVINARDTVRWPTMNRSFNRGEPKDSFIQPTVSGEVQSGLFGCVRENGQRFHEAIDLKAIRHDRRGEAKDLVLAAMDGRVTYVNRRVERSDYGRYVVIEHMGAQPDFYTLYAHLSLIKTSVRVGVMVKSGTVLGIMGRSDRDGNIPKERAHLHFEMGLRLSNNFSAWYEGMDFDTPNYHGNFNGMNLNGFDPLEFFTRYRNGQVDTVQAYLQSLPTAYSLRVATKHTPYFIRRYPCLLTGPASDDLVGWDVEFTGFGLPVRWTPLSRDNSPGPMREGDVTLITHSPGLLKKSECINSILMEPGGVELGGSLRRTIHLLFDFR